MLLKGKVAVVYGAGGAIGGAVASAFAREGARVFRAGRTLATDGGAGTAQVDALDEQAVEAHLGSVVAAEGRVDIAFDAVGIPNAEILGVPLVDLDAGRFALPIATHAGAWFLIARLAARHMLAQGSGVLMTVTATHAREGIPLVGGYGPAMAAKEALTRGLSAELAPHGIRVVGLRPQAMPESPTIRDAFTPRAVAAGLTWEQWQERLAARTHPRRLMTLAELADVAAFVASDRASGLTGTTVNLTLGRLDD